MAFRGESIVASAWTRRAVASQWRYQVDLFAAIHPHRADVFRRLEAVPPTVGLSDAASLDLGGVEVRVAPAGWAHTPGDLIAHVAADGVAFAGDLVFNELWPVLWDASYAGWLRALGNLRRSSSVIVPGHGPAGGIEIVDAMADCLRFLRELARVREADRAAALEASAFAGWRHPEFAADAVTSLSAAAPEVAADRGR